jgi:hypothetical protein
VNGIGQNPVVISASKRVAGSSPGERERLLAMAHSRADFVTLGHGGVQIFPGTAYGGGEGCVRASFLQPTTALETALERITPVIQALRAG